MSEEPRYNKDGALINGEGRIVVPGKSAFTPANAAENARKSHEARRRNSIQAAKDGIMAGLSTKDILVKSPWGGMALIIAAQTELAMDISKGNASTQAAKFVLDQADMLVRDEKEDNGKGGVTINEATAMKLAKLLMEKQEIVTIVEA